MTTGLKAIKCVLVGDCGVGKTSLLLAYTTDAGSFTIREYVPTVLAPGCSVELVVDDTPVSLGLCDTVGHSDYECDRLPDSSHYPHTDVFLVCVSIASPVSFESARAKWSAELAHHCPEAPKLLVGTKADLRFGGGETAAVVPPEQGDRLAKEIGAAAYVECSALTQHGLKNVFDEAVRLALTNPKKNRTGKCSLF
jgi:small GTP-binding protein